MNENIKKRIEYYYELANKQKRLCDIEFWRGWAKGIEEGYLLTKGDSN